jgi:hypothetical protein
MRRCFSLLLPVVLAALTLAACDHDWKYIAITNESDYPVIFKFNNVEGEKSLLAGQSQTFDSYWTTELDYYAPDKRVSYSYTSDRDSVSGAFKNRPSWEIRVNNTLNIPVNLSADGWMEDMANIPPSYDSDQNHAGVIFTDKPIFSVSTGSFPATAQYQIIDGIMYVTIK